MNVLKTDVCRRRSKPRADVPALPWFTGKVSVLFRLFALTLCLALPSTSAAQLKVLFIGNSFTQGGGEDGVPGIFDRLAQAGGHKDPHTVMRAVGGKDYRFHSEDPATQAVIRSEPWDYVILQNYSTEPTHAENAKHPLENHFNYGKLLYEQITANRAETRVVLYETWSRAADHDLITGVSGPDSFAGTDEFQAELRTNYVALAEQLTTQHPQAPPVTVARVGDAWQRAGGLKDLSDPDYVNLHGSDRYHGNDNGYYLAAAVFYSHIFRRNPVGLGTHEAVRQLNLDLTVPSSYLEQVAWTTVSGARD